MATQIAAAATAITTKRFIFAPQFVNYRRGNSRWVEWFRCEARSRHKAWSFKA
jgi:hypothetical protein